MTPPLHPAGEYVPDPNPTAAKRAQFIEELASFHIRLSAAVTDLSERQLDQKYNNWTIRQIVHHLADSHVNCFVRQRMTLTEENPTIKPYDESKWSELPDNKTMDIVSSLELLSGIHERLVNVFRLMTPEQFARTYYHPEYQKSVSLGEMLGLYAHHGRHHLAQIEWVKANRMG